jgi:hypothetical protein
MSTHERVSGGLTLVHVSAMQPLHALVKSNFVGFLAKKRKSAYGMKSWHMANNVELNSV